MVQEKLESLEDNEEDNEKK